MAFAVKHLPKHKRGVDYSLVDYGIVRLYANNIRNVLEIAVERQYNASSWYDDAAQQIREVAQCFAPYGVTFQDVAWIVATLSPGVSWDNGQNLKSAISFLSDWFGLPCEYRNNGYGPNTYKCECYMLGEIDHAPTGPKVSAFYSNLMGVKDILTIDRHAMRVALFGVWRLSDETGDMVPSVRERKLITQAYQIVANEYGLELSEIQSITWQVVNEKAGA